MSLKEIKTRLARIVNTDPGPSAPIERATIRRLVLVGVLIAAGFWIMAQTHSEPVAEQAGIAVIHPWARGTALVGDQLAVFATFENGGEKVDRLIGVETPLAHNAVLRVADTRTGRARATELDELSVQPKAKVSLRPEQHQIALIGLKERIEPGRSIPITFIFSRAGRLSTEVRVEGPGQPPHEDHS